MTVFEKLPDDILNYLNDFIDIKSKVNLFYSKNNNQGLIEMCYIKKITKSYEYLTDKILQQNIFNQLIEINVRNNRKVTDLNRFSQTLQIINIGYNCGVDDNGIKDCLKLINIKAYFNQLITNLNKFYQKLEIIDIGWYCGVGDSGIKDCLKLIEIKAHRNQKIKDLNNFYQTLEIIDVSYNCGVDDNGIKDCLKLIEIN